MDFALEIRGRLDQIGQPDRNVICGANRAFAARWRGIRSRPERRFNELPEREKQKIESVQAMAGRASSTCRRVAELFLQMNDAEAAGISSMTIAGARPRSGSGLPIKVEKLETAGKTRGVPGLEGATVMRRRCSSLEKTRISIMYAGLRI